MLVYIILAIKMDNCTNVKGFSVWTLMDNFEWLEGYSHKYGMFHVDRNDPELRRIPKASSVLYSQVSQLLTTLSSRCFISECPCLCI